MIGRKAGSITASWWTTAFLLVLAGGTYLPCTFGQTPYARWSGFLLHSPAGLSLWIALIANLIAVSVRLIWSRMKTPAASVSAIGRMDVCGEFARPDDGDLSVVLSWMRRHGFSGEIRDNGIAGSKKRFAFLPGALLRAGLVVMLSAVLFSAYQRKTEETVMHAGEKHFFGGSKITLSDIKSDIPKEFLLVGDESSFALKRVSAMVLYEGGEYKVTPGFPASIGGRYYRVTGLGFSHEFLLESEGRKTAQRLDLNILPPGVTDVVDLAPRDMVLTFTLHPAKTIQKGLLTGRDFFLDDPTYRIVVQKGKQKERPEAVLIKAGTEETLPGLTASLGKKSLFVKISSVYDPALPTIYTGFLIFLAGLVLMPARFFWYERQLVALLEGDRLLIGYRQEYFKKWGIQKFLMMMEDLPPEAGVLSDVRIIGQ